MRWYRPNVTLAWHWLCLCAVFLAFGAVPAAADSLSSQGSPPHIRAELVAESAVRPGGTVMLAIVMEPESGWHGYWRNPGDAGLGMTLDWQLPPGVKVGAPLYPVPSTMLVAGLMNHVYESDYALLVPLTMASGFTPGVRVPVAVEAQWLACSATVCVPERGRLETLIEIWPPYGADKRFERWRTRLPAPLSAPARFDLASDRLRLAIPLPAGVALERPHLFVGEERVVDYAAPQVFSRKGDTLVVELRRARVAPADPRAITAVLRLNGRGDGLEISASPGAVPAGGRPLPADAPAVLPALPFLLLAALAGGLLLNVMPCVFPILSLKAISLARAGESQAHARIEGLAYAAGVIAACMALGAVLLALRAGGAQIGWAFQLQEPAVVALLVLAAVAITANFMGLYEFAVPGFAREGSARGAFATGLLAAFVATPCTGPFMAAAMGAALLLPALPAMALFAALGLGIALPFLAIAFVPGLRRMLPRPGPWMVRFRHWMALPMALTALALLWLAGRLGGWPLAVLSAACALVMLGALRAVGLRQRRGQGVLVPVLAALALGLAAVAGASTAAMRTPAAGGAERDLLGAVPFSQGVIDRARAEGRPVFVWFTADWCLTCKVNERVAIEREDVRRVFAGAGVVVVKGDWTRRDPAITRYLTDQGAAGVPLYVWYPAGGGAPRQLPQVLTPSSLTELTRSDRAQPASAASAS